MSRIDTLTAYSCKFSYMQRNNPMIEEQREAMERGTQLPGAGGFNSPWLDVTDSEEDDENDLNSNLSENQEF